MSYGLTGPMAGRPESLVRGRITAAVVGGASNGENIRLRHRRSVFFPVSKSGETGGQNGRFDPVAPSPCVTVSVRGDRILVVDFGLIRLRSFKFIGIRINAIVQVAKRRYLATWTIAGSRKSTRSAIQPFAW
jgi:hypothetical protein